MDIATQAWQIRFSDSVEQSRLPWSSHRPVWIRRQSDTINFVSQALMDCLVGNCEVPPATGTVNLCIVVGWCYIKYWLVCTNYTTGNSVTMKLFTRSTLSWRHDHSVASHNSRTSPGWQIQQTQTKVEKNERIVQITLFVLCVKRPVSWPHRTTNRLRKYTNLITLDQTKITLQ